MASMRSCPDCKRRISYSASTCPGCGCDIEGTDRYNSYQMEREAYCQKHGIKETEYQNHLDDIAMQEYAEWAEEQQEVNETEEKEIAKNKERDKKALLKRIEKENAKRAAKERKDAA